MQSELLYRSSKSTGDYLQSQQFSPAFRGSTDRPGPVPDSPDSHSPVLIITAAFTPSVERDYSARFSPQSKRISEYDHTSIFACVAIALPIIAGLRNPKCHA